MKNNFIYSYMGEPNIYVNLTNRCTNNCEFCIRNHFDTVDGEDLWLEREPSAEEIISALEERGIASGDTVVFCGYGEPTFRFDVAEEVCAYVHLKGAKTRINTNGHGNRILGKDICARTAAAMDTVNVSLNATDADKYDAVCRCAYGKEGFGVMLDFARGCVKCGGNVVLSVVDCIGEDEVAKARLIAEDVGAKLRVRKFV